MARFLAAASAAIAAGCAFRFGLPSTTGRWPRRYGCSAQDTRLQSRTSAELQQEQSRHLARMALTGVKTLDSSMNHRLSLGMGFVGRTAKHAVRHTGFRFAVNSGFRGGFAIRPISPLWHAALSPELSAIAGLTSNCVLYDAVFDML